MSPLTGKLKAQLKNEKNDQLKSNFLFFLKKKKLSYIHRLTACVYNTFLDILDLYLSAFFFFPQFKPDAKNRITVWLLSKS